MGPERSALKQALEDTLHRRVDLIRRRNLKPAALASAGRNAILLIDFMDCEAPSDTFQDAVVRNHKFIVLSV